MKTKFLGAATIVAALGFAAPASAELVSVTAWGTVFIGADPIILGGDPTGIFGGGDLTGESFVAHYVYDTSLGLTLSTPVGPYAYGGSYFGDEPPSPIVSAIVTINGHSVSIAGDYQTAFGGENTANFSLQNYHVEHGSIFGPIDNFTDIVIENDFSGTIPSSITGPFTYEVDVASGDHAVGDVFLINYAAGTETFAYANLTRLTVGPVEAVPEASTWAMMLLGFVGLGYAGYRRARLAV